MAFRILKNKLLLSDTTEPLSETLLIRMSLLKKILIVFIFYNLMGCRKSLIIKKEKENINIILEKLVTIDQQLVKPNPNGTYIEIPNDRWNSFKDSVFRQNTSIMKNLFYKYGFLDSSSLGKNGAFNFWLIVQHSDFDLNFQKKVLNSMKKSVQKKRTDRSNYAYLFDRVQINSNQKQKFGTQLTYNEYGQAVLKNCPTDTSRLIELRREYGLEELFVYLNKATLLHFNLNKDYYKKKGILEPVLY